MLEGWEPEAEMRDLTVTLFPVPCRCSPSARRRTEADAQGKGAYAGHRALEEGRARGGSHGQTEDTSFPSQLPPSRNETAGEPRAADGIMASEAHLSAMCHVVIPAHCGQTCDQQY